MCSQFFAFLVLSLCALQSLSCMLGVGIRQWCFNIDRRSLKVLLQLIVNNLL